MVQTYAAIDQSAQSVTTVLGHLDARTDSIQTSFSGSAAPGTPAVGWIYYDTDDEALYQYGDQDGTGNAWNEIANLAQLNGDLNFNQNEALNMRLENLGAHGTPASGNDGEIYLLTSDGECYFLDFTVDNSVKKILSVIAGTTTDAVVIPFGPLDASNPPTAGTKGTTPTVRGWLFDATNEIMSLNVRVPANYSADGDLTLRLVCVLNQAETAADDIDWTVDLLSLADGESTTGTSTAATVAHDIGSDNADGDVHFVDITIDYDDASNPVAAGDELLMEIHRTNLDTVDGVILTSAYLIYPCDGAVH